MRVLIVEDEPVIALEIEAIVVARLPDAEVVVASSVSDALNAVDGAVGLAFLDIDVTDGKTYPLALELRLREIPFVFVSGAAIEDAPDGLSNVTFITKPFSPSQIRQAVDSLSDPKPGGRADS